jgi:hypothetical protein
MDPTTRNLVEVELAEMEAAGPAEQLRVELARAELAAHVAEHLRVALGDLDEPRGSP